MVVFDPAGIPANHDGPVPANAVKLVIEVADSSLADDLGQKQIDYAAAGLLEYWVADVRGRVMHLCHTPQPDGYAVRNTQQFGIVASAITLPLQVRTEGL